MKIIYVHQYFLTPEEGGATRSYHLAKGLVDAGIEVDMITGHNSPAYQLKVIKGIKVHYLPVPYDNEFGFAKRIHSFLRFVFKAIGHIKKLDKPDLLYISSTPLTTGIIGIWSKKRWGVPYLFEVRDLWPEAPIQLGVIQNLFLKKLLYGLERSIYRHARKIVALSPGIKTYVQQKVKDKTVYCIPNFSDLGFFNVEINKNQARREFGLQEKFTISYTGAIGPVNYLNDFLYLASESEKSGKDWQFCIMGRGSCLIQLKVLSKQLRLKNFFFLPFSQKEKARDLIKVSDICFVSFAPAAVLQTSSPNKFFDAIAGGKPVLINQKGWLYDLIQKYQLGIYHEPTAYSKTIEHLEKWENDPCLSKNAELKGKELAFQHFSREKAVRQLLKVLEVKDLEVQVSDGVYSRTF